jgi:hypothetical protein
MRSNLPYAEIAEIYVRRVEVIKRFMRKNPIPLMIRAKIQKEINKLESNEVTLEEVFMNPDSPLRIAFVFMDMKENVDDLGDKLFQAFRNAI